MRYFIFCLLPSLLPGRWWVSPWSCPAPGQLLPKHLHLLPLLYQLAFRAVNMRPVGLLVLEDLAQQLPLSPWCSGSALKLSCTGSSRAASLSCRLPLCIYAQWFGTSSPAWPLSEQQPSSSPQQRICYQQALSRAGGQGEAVSLSCYSGWQIGCFFNNCSYLCQLLSSQARGRSRVRVSEERRPITLR